MKTVLVLNMVWETEINEMDAELEESEFAKRLQFDTSQEQATVR